MIESVGPLRWQLPAPHLGLADYRVLQRLGLRSYLRRSHTHALIFILVGIAIMLLPIAAANYWNVRMGGGISIGSGDHRLLIIRGERLRLAALALVAIGAAAMWVCQVANYSRLIRRIYNGSRRAMAHWSLDVGEDGLRMVWSEVTVMVPWSNVRDLHSNRTATFLTFDSYFKAVGISHAAFATDTEREACLSFMRAKILPAPQARAG